MKKLQSLLAIFWAVLLVCGLLPVQKAEAATSKDGYLSLQEAAAYVRKELAEFKTDVKVRFYLNSTENYTKSALWELLKTEVIKHTGVPDEGDYMKWSFQQVGYYVESEFDGKTHYVTVDNISPIYNNTAAQEKELEKKLDQVFASLNLSGKSDYEKIKLIYEYVCKNVSYSDEVTNSGADPLLPPDELKVYYSAYGALVLGSTTCQGFSSLIYRMMLKAGIDCRLIAGDQHGWNIVKLDGKYYYLEPTWDSSNYQLYGELEYFLDGSASFRTCGKKMDGGVSSNEHKAWTEQFNAEFLAQYPISALDYGEKDLLTGDANTVLGSGKCGDQANWTLTADGKLTISGTGAIWDAGDGTFWFTGTEFQERWDGLNGYIKQVQIQQGITAVGSHAFMNCPRLAQVSFASSVGFIGDFAFAMCENLSQITLPNTVKTLGTNVFYQCVRLEKATLSAGMQEVPENTFIGCTSLKTVQIPNGIQKIGTSAFAVCYRLQDLQLPASVTTLGPMAFAQSFDSAKKVTVTIPGTVTQIGWDCFAQSNLYGIKINAKIDKLDSYMFNLCHYLQTVELSDSIKSFADNAFYGCANLRNVKLPSGLKDLGVWPFVDCSSLERIELPATLTEIPGCAFLRCASLKEIVIPDSVKVIGNSAFEGCTSLQRVTIPASVEKIEDGAFGWVELKTVKFEGDMPELGVNSFMFVGDVTVYHPRNNSTWTQAAKDQLSMGNPYVTFVATHGPDEPHTSGTWQEGTDTHWMICPDCGTVSQEAPHSWDTGRVTKQPTCAETGERTYSCETCGATRGESIPKTTTHVYDFVCDEQCNICGQTRNVTHQYSEQWSANAQSHWHGCTVCGGRKDEQAHVPGPEATEEDAQLCTQCDWVIQPALNHVHDENMQLQYDEVAHWYTCSGCSEKVEFSEHSWANACNENCDVCGYTRITTHQYSQDWMYDAAEHWHACTECGAKTDLAAHSWGDSGCVDCYAQQDQNPTDPETTDPTVSEPDATEPSDSVGDKEKKFPIWIPIVTVVVLAGAAGAAILLKKKRS